MKDALINLLFFSAKAFIIVAFILVLVMGVLALLTVGKEKILRDLSTLSR
jgi:uncharacterized integral membrane protein